MEEILSKLLVPDNAIILQGTRELQEAFKKPEVIPALCNVVGVSQNPQIRQYAAVLLRKRLSKSRNWTKLPVNVKNGIKEGILQAMVNEQETYVKNSIAQFIGTIVRHEFPNQNWPEMLQFIQQLTSSDNISDKELGMYTMSVITDISPDQFLPFISSVAFLFSNVINSLQDPGSALGYYTVLTMIHFVPLAERDQRLLNVYHQLMPQVMQIVRALVVTDSQQAIKAMELFDDLVKYAAVVIASYIKPLVEMFLEFASNRTLDDGIRTLAVTFIGVLTRTKKKAIVKHKLVNPILEVIFQLLSLSPESGDREDTEAIITSASHTLDVMALHLPPDKLLPPLLQHIQRGLEGTDLYAKKASYLALAAVVEGCCDCIRTKHLESFLQCICKGITDQVAIVRDAALFALGQFSEHLQPDISCYASQILPVLFDQFASVCSQLQEKLEPHGLDHMFYALEMFCENLADALLPYLPTLMDRLFTALNPKNCVHLRELALSCIGAAAVAAKSGMVPYIPCIIESLLLYLTMEVSEEIMCLQTQSLDTLGVLAQSVGAEHFSSLAQETVHLGLTLLCKTDDPKLRKSCYGLFGALSVVLKDDMKNVLPTIIEKMLDTLRSSDGIVEAHYNDDEASAIAVYEDLSDTPDEEDIENESEESEDEDISGYCIHSADMEEKEEACRALSEIAKNCGETFIPYLENSFEDVFKMTNYPYEDIRKAAVDALCQFCITLNGIQTPECRIAVSKALSMLIPKCAELIHTDEERSVVMRALDAYTEVLKEIRGPVLEGEGHRDAIFNCVKDVMTYKTECQGEEDEDGVNMDDPEAEQDEMLIEYAGDIVPVLGKAMAPDDFAQYFRVLLPLFANRTKKHCTVAQRSFAVGTLSESLEPLGPNIGQFVPQLLPLFLELSRDESDEVRNNAIYGIGEMALHGKEAVFPHYLEILQALSTTASKEKHAGTLDNVCGALARLIITNVSGVPMTQVFPVFVNYLPLREDFDENKAVFECMTYLYQLGHPMLLSHLTPVMKAGFVVLCERQGVKDTLDLVLNFMKTMQLNFRDQCSNVVATLPQEYLSTIQQMFS
ncbi:importin-4-like isoform X1 [Zootermopsis nevadensis]|uniref:importin-4-like isoform X1 n=1 Tax=Zootermopsis nevadensis TaxID=136037 RepID=UPI000B8EB301|nr:importin-4-like isoform X1 [Zootermopsis nevadensis]